MSWPGYLNPRSLAAAALCQPASLLCPAHAQRQGVPLTFRPQKNLSNWGVGDRGQKWMVAEPLRLCDKDDNLEFKVTLSNMHGLHYGVALEIQKKVLPPNIDANNTSQNG